MDLVLAMDLMKGQVVYGQKGERDSYRPLSWGPIPSSDPQSLLRYLQPRYLYIADLDRIQGRGSQDRWILDAAEHVERCYCDRGCRSPDDLLHHDRIVNVIGTETAGTDLSQYHGGFLSVDVNRGRVLPTGEDPVEILSRAQRLDFDGCILLNIGAVGTTVLPESGTLAAWRGAYRGRLFYGGGVGDRLDLDLLEQEGYDGVILATALYNGQVPLDWIQGGVAC
jgi:phosphoribosylformimino-5-aminoimidazole carboxamide ribotide isomerase